MLNVVDYKSRLLVFKMHTACYFMFSCFRVAVD